jgi:ribosome maturation factor RimP
VGRKEDILSRIRAIAEPLAEGEGLELVDVEITGAGGRSVLRLYIDKKGGSQLPAEPGVDAGLRVSLEDCSNLSHAVSAALDVEDPLEGAYDLEVSSPGLDRPLRKPEHFVKYAGQRIRLKTYSPIESAGGRKTFIGKLLGMTGDLVRVEVDGREYDVPLSQVGKANIEPVIEF